MKKRQIFFPVWGVLLMALFLTGCDRQLQFDRAEQEFRRATDLQSEVLGQVLSAYATHGPERFGYLHDGYLHDGTFALLDSLDEEAGHLLDRMVRFCGRQTAGRLVECMTLRARLVRRLNDAEAPFIYRAYPPAWEALEPDAEAWLHRLKTCECDDCRPKRRIP